MPRHPPDPVIEPRGMRLPNAAAYVGISQTKFLDLVQRGVFPSAKKIDSISLWDRRALDRALDAIFEEEPYDRHSDPQL